MLEINQAPESHISMRYKIRGKLTANLILEVMHQKVTFLDKDGAYQLQTLYWQIMRLQSFEK